MTDTWGGRRAMAARQTMAATLPTPCGRCGHTVHPDPPGTPVRRSGWVVGHVIARSLRPDLTWQRSNWRVEHRGCSDRSAQAAVIEKARAEGAALADAGFPLTTHPGTAPPLPFSPSGGQRRPVEARPELLWTEETLASHAWLHGLLPIPEDGSPPLWMSPPPADAVGSYGAEACEWIEAELGIRLRWWQRLAITRQLEHRADGSLCHREVLESAPRRAGKSVRVRGLALWRMAHADLFGELQCVVHTGSDLAVCRKLQRDSWAWARATGWPVTTANGKEAIETPAGDQWLVRSQGAVYGWDTTLGVVDEAWDVKPDTVSEGLEPSTLERSSPQLHLTSTAHRRATSLMRTRLAAALTVDDPEVLLLVWAAPPGADPADPRVWRAASPHWSAERERMIGRKYAAALAGEVDPQADDPDPMAGFVAQYLNVWRLDAAPRAVKGSEVVDVDEWAELAVETPGTVPDAVAVEGWFDEGVAVASAWRTESGIVVSVADYATVSEAAEAVKAIGCLRPTSVGASLQSDPAWRAHGVRTRAATGTTAAAAGDLARLLAEGLLAHDGGAVLTDQVVALRVSPSADGVRMASSARADGVKAAIWAASIARRGGTRRMRLLLPSTT